MNGELLEILGVGAAALRSRADFFESESSVLDGLEAQRSSRPIGSDWRTDACKATALRLAAQFAILVDTNRARQCMLESAQHYIRLGIPYGFFLMAAADPRTAADRIFEDAPRPEPAEEDDPSISLAAMARRTPVQLVYYVLVLSGQADAAREFGSVREAFRARASAHRWAPIGPQSVPIKRYLDLADSLVEYALRGVRDEGSTQVLADRTVMGLAPLATRYAQNVEAARANSYLWERLHAPVDLVDLDIVGVAALAQSLAGDFRAAFAEAVESRLRDMPPLERVSIAAGLGFGYSDGIA